MDSWEKTIKARLWIYEAPAPWYMITVPLKESTEIKKKFGMFHRGWGSIPVIVQIGSSNWKTSIFWEKKGTYLLPIKKEIRKAESLMNGNELTLTLLIQNLV